MKISDILRVLEGYGSGMTIERETDYNPRKHYYHIRMFGLIYPDKYEVVDTSLSKALRQVLKDSQTFGKAKQLIDLRREE